MPRTRWRLRVPRRRLPCKMVGHWPPTKHWAPGLRAIASAAHALAHRGRATAARRHRQCCAHRRGEGCWRPRRSTCRYQSGRRCLAAGGDSDPAIPLRRAGERLRVTDLAAFSAAGIARITVREPRVEDSAADGGVGIWTMNHRVMVAGRARPKRRFTTPGLVLPPNPCGSNERSGQRFRCPTSGHSCRHVQARAATASRH